MSEETFNQEAWLARIGYRGSPSPTLETLNGLILAHAQAIAYESLDIMLGRTPKLDLPSLQSKMIDGGRGGYCFEQNMLFRAGLRSLGYDVTSLQGRFVRGLSIDAARPAIHMLLKVDLPEGTYLADVGFGNLAPTCALQLIPDIEQETPHELMRFTMVGSELTLQAKLGNSWEHIYRVIPHPRVDAEYEICNWYTATHPAQPYLTNIIAARPGPNRTRLTMFNSRVNLRHADGAVERRLLESEEDYRNVLTNEFGLNMPEDDLRAILTLVRNRATQAQPHPFFA